MKVLLPEVQENKNSFKTTECVLSFSTCPFGQDINQTGFIGHSIFPCLFLNIIILIEAIRLNCKKKKKLRINYWL